MVYKTHPLTPSQEGDAANQCFILYNMHFFLKQYLLSCKSCSMLISPLGRGLRGGSLITNNLTFFAFLSVKRKFSTLNSHYYQILSLIVYSLMTIPTFRPKSMPIFLLNTYPMHSTWDSMNFH